MIAKGNQPAVVVPVTTEHGEWACQFGHSKKKQTPQVCVTFEILRGPYAGQRISWFGYFTDKSEKRTLEALRICGFEGDDLDKFADQRPTNEVQLVIEHEADEEGKVRAKVAWVNDPTFGGGMKMENALSGGDLRKFGAKFKAALKAIPAMKTVEAKREAPSAASEDDPPADDFARSRRENFDQSPKGSQVDDDIPF
jgi:hypothetical protein